MKRDHRIDFVRGMALVWIFWNHIQGSFLNWLTIRNYGLSDATEIFVFISGMAFARAYGSHIGASRQAPWSAWSRSIGRVGVIYLTHLHAVAALVGLAVIWGLVSGDMSVLKRLGLDFDFEILHSMSPAVSMSASIATLQLKPENLDILPLYMVLITFAVPALFLVSRRPALAVMTSCGVYLMAHHAGWHLMDRDGRPWVFNPFAWQLVFVLGMVCGLNGDRIRAIYERRSIRRTAWTIVILGGGLVLSWSVPALHEAIPTVVAQWLYPIDKPNADSLRILHFLALAVLFVSYTRADAPVWQGAGLQAVARIGRQGLPCFAYGVVLSFLASRVLEVAGQAALAQIVVGVLGVVLLWALSGLHERASGALSGNKPKETKAMKSHCYGNSFRTPDHV